MVNKNRTLAIYFISTIVLISNLSHCMLSKWTHQPVILPNSPEFIAKRKNWETKFYPIKIRECTADEQQNTCGYFAIKEITGSTAFHYLSNNDKDTTINIEKYFDQTEKPKKNDLVVYTTSTTDLIIKHYAVYYDDNFVINKWGVTPGIKLNLLSKVPYRYGMAVAFFTLKPQYVTPDGKLLLQKEICSDALLIADNYFRNLHQAKEANSIKPSITNETQSAHKSKSNEQLFQYGLLGTLIVLGAYSTYKIVSR